MSKEFTKLVETIAMLRHPTKGCPWDLEQDHQTLLPYLIEESYEYIQAVKEGNFKEMEEELGDVLLQVLLHAQIAKDNNKFDIESVCQKLNEKMVRRHPHVFTEIDRNVSMEELHKNWARIKAEEKEDHPKQPRHFFQNKDNATPPLIAANKIGKKSKKVDFDWDNSKEVWEKVQEEMKELEHEIKMNNKKKCHEELGDLLFTIAQLARHLEIDPHDALHDANQKFITRFQNIEKRISPKKIEDFDRAEKEQLWIKAKKDEKA